MRKVRFSTVGIGQRFGYQSFGTCWLRIVAIDWGTAAANAVWIHGSSKSFRLFSPDTIVEVVA